MENTGLQLDWPGHLVGLTDSQRAMRSTLHLRDLRNGAVLHPDRDWPVYPALETSGRAAPLPRHGVSMGARGLRVNWSSLDIEYYRHSTDRSVLGHADCIGGGGRGFLLAGGGGDTGICGGGHGWFFLRPFS